MNNYWVVGASWGGVDYQDERFIKEGIWMLGWDESEQPAQYKKAQDMKTDDRIAIKRMRGPKGGLKILHIGVIKGVILDANRVICTVDWAATNLNRNIEHSHGCLASIHGPYNYEKDKWIQEVFCL